MLNVLNDEFSVNIKFLFCLLIATVSRFTRLICPCRIPLCAHKAFLTHPKRK